MSSSLDALTDLLEDQFADSDISSSSSRNNMQKSQRQTSGSRSGSGLNFDKINNLLNIQPSEQEQVEAGIAFSAMGMKRFFALDNHTIEQLPQSE